MSSMPTTALKGSRKCRRPVFAELVDYWSLTKPEINFLILITTFAGFYLGCKYEGHNLSLLALFNTLSGTLLVASGTATLNQYVERGFDAKMRRTARRPAAAGRLAPRRVLTFGIALSLAGSIYLAAAVTLLASALALFTLLSYLFLYTPLKRRTLWCVLIGAFPGAMPPLIGWSAASGRLSTEAWILYAILLLWQFPHFMAIAWMYREDYDRAGYRVLPNGNARVSFVMVETMVPLLALVLISLLQSPVGNHAVFYGAELFLGLGFAYFGGKFIFQRSRVAARRLLAASIVYLPVLFALSTVFCRSSKT
jgi:heme o synthase